MKIRLNEDKEVVRSVQEGLKRTGGYCPCRLQRTPENKCMCKEFKEQIADPDFEGYCHCRLYYKEKCPAQRSPGEQRLSGGSCYDAVFSQGRKTWSRVISSRL